MPPTDPPPGLAAAVHRASVDAVNAALGVPPTGPGRLTAASEQLLRDFDRTPDAIDYSELSARLWLIERQAATPPPTDPTAALRTALAEGLHKAMCFGPPVLHNRLACERPAVYLNLADAALAHPAVAEVIGVQQRSTDAAFGALDCTCVARPPLPQADDPAPQRTAFAYAHPFPCPLNNPSASVGDVCSCSQADDPSGPDVEAARADAVLEVLTNEGWVADPDATEYNLRVVTLIIEAAIRAESVRTDR